MTSIDTIAEIDGLGPRRRAGATVAAVPGERVTALRVPVPEGVKPSVARAIAAGAAQDWAALSESDGQCVPLPGEGPARTVLIADRADLAAWSAALGDRGRGGLRVLPDYLCGPWQDEAVTLSDLGSGRVAVRLSRTEGFTAPAALVRGMLEPALRASEARVLQCRAADRATLAPILEAAPLPVETVADTTPANPPDGSLLGTEGWTAALAGPMARARAAALAACAAAGLVWSVGAWQTASQLEREAAMARAQAEGIARDTFGLAGPILDLRLQVQRRIDTAQAAASDAGAAWGFAALLERAAPVLAAQEVRIDELRYEANALHGAVSLSGFSALEALVRRLRRAGLDVAVERSRLDGTDGLRAQLRLTRPAGGG